MSQLQDHVKQIIQQADKENNFSILNQLYEHHDFAYNFDEIRVINYYLILELSQSKFVQKEDMLNHIITFNFNAISNIYFQEQEPSSKVKESQNKHYQNLIDCLISYDKVEHVKTILPLINKKVRATKENISYSIKYNAHNCFNYFYSLEGKSKLKTLSYAFSQVVGYKEAGFSSLKFFNNIINHPDFPETIELLKDIRQPIYSIFGVLDLDVLIEPTLHNPTLRTNIDKHFSINYLFEHMIQREADFELDCVTDNIPYQPQESFLLFLKEYDTIKLLECSKTQNLLKRHKNDSFVQVIKSFALNSKLEQDLSEKGSAIKLKL